MGVSEDAGMRGKAGDALDCVVFFRDRHALCFSGHFHGLIRAIDHLTLMTRGPWLMIVLLLERSVGTLLESFSVSFREISLSTSKPPPWDKTTSQSSFHGPQRCFRSGKYHHRKSNCVA